MCRLYVVGVLLSHHPLLCWPLLTCNLQEATACWQQAFGMLRRFVETIELVLDGHLQPLLAWLMTWQGGRDMTWVSKRIENPRHIQGISSQGPMLLVPIKCDISLGTFDGKSGCNICDVLTAWKAYCASCSSDHLYEQHLPCFLPTSGWLAIMIEDNRSKFWSNFRQYYGQMKQQTWEESEKRKEEKKSEKRKSKRKEEVARRCVFPVFCGSGGSKSRLAKAAGAQPSGRMRDQKLMKIATRLWRKAHLEVKTGALLVWELRCRKRARGCGAKHIWKSKRQKHLMSGPLLDVQASFCVAGAMDSAPRQKWVTGVDLAAISKTMAGVGHLRSICKGTWHVVWQARYRRHFGQTWSAVREQISWEVFCILAHQIIRFVNMISRDRCSTLHDLASLFRGNSTLEKWDGKIAKHTDRRPSAAQLWTFIFSGRLAGLLCWICAHPFFEEIWHLTELPTFR